MTSKKIYIFIIIFLFFLLLIFHIDEEKDSINSKFKPKINYDNSLTSLACSIEKYFDINPFHKTLPYMDKLFEEKKPENVILLVVDGLGSRIMKKLLDKNSFLVKNMKMEINSVFPSATASCLNSIKTGLNPSEHGWLGWSTYVPPIKKIIFLFSNEEKGKRKNDKEFEKIKDIYYNNNKPITELINNKGKYLAFELNCFPHNVEKNIDIVFERILETLKIQGKKYIFSYYNKPDEIFHSKGIESKEVIDEIKKLNDKVEEYSKLILEHDKTMMIIVADHGNIVAIPEKILNSKICKYLKTNKLLIENRTPGFLVKAKYQKEFIKEFNKNYGKDFFLLSKKEILKHKIYGEYSSNTKHKLFEKSIGDFMAIAKDSSNKILFGESDHKMITFHGAYSEDEIYIPLIVLSN